MTQKDEQSGYVYFTKRPKGFLCGENFCSYAYKCDKVHDRSCPYLAIMDRLFAYESTGLEPQEIARIVDEYGHGHTLRTHAAERLELIREIPTDRLRELVEADREGRCVVLKFKPDTFVYRAWPGVGKRPPFVTAHYLDTMDACIEAQLWNNAYQSDEAAEAALKGGQHEKH